MHSIPQQTCHYSDRLAVDDLNRVPNTGAKIALRFRYAGFLFDPKYCTDKNHKEEFLKQIRNIHTLLAQTNHSYTNSH